MRGKEILVISIIVLLFSSSIVIPNIHATTSKSIEQRVKDLLKKGDTINEALSIATVKEIENSKYLSKLLEKSEKQREKDLKKYEEMEQERKELSEFDVAVLCGATEDYEENKEQCDKLYDMLEEGEIKDDPNFEYD